MTSDRLDAYPLVHLSDDEERKVAASHDRRSLWQLIHGVPSVHHQLRDEPAWTEGMISTAAPEAIDQAPFLSLGDLGYTDDVLNSDLGERVSRPGLVGPFRLLSDNGTRALHGACNDLLSKHGVLAGSNERRAPIVARRVRRADAQSQVLHSFTQSDRVRAAVERACGAPVIPHPHRYARTQVNYYGQGADVARWHRDGMNVVLTVLLTTRPPDAGGDYLINDQSGVCRIEASKPRNAAIRAVPMRCAGDAIVTRGNLVDHCVTPVRDGTRITLAVSFYVLGARGNDANRFLHSLPDDGLLRTLRAWWEFRSPWRTERRVRELSQIA
jgi:hypothetical protein